MALSDLNTVERNEAGIATVLGILKQRFGERFQTGQSIREQHAHTTTYIPAQAPDGVVFPESTEEVQEIVRHLRRAQGAGHRLRRRYVARRSSQRAGRRHLARHVAHEPHRRGQP